MNPKHPPLVNVQDDRVIILLTEPRPCGECKKAAYLFVNMGGVTTCSGCGK